MFHIVHTSQTGSYLKESKHLSVQGQVATVTSMLDAAFHPNGVGCAVLRAPSFFLVVSVMLFSLVGSAPGHPQCLDFEPPFKPQWHLEFCTQYEQFGCCDQKADNMIAERYWGIIDQLEVSGYELCADTLKEIMCQVNILSFLNVGLYAFEDAIAMNRS